MSSRAKEGASLAALVRMAIPLCRAAERVCPTRRGPGCRPDYAEWVVAVLIMIAILKRRKSKSAQHRYLHEHRRELMEWLGLERFPSRTTYFERYRRAHRLFETAIRLQGQKAIREGVGNPETVAVDKSLVQGRGPQWHKKDRRANRIPRKLRGVDRESAWGYSEHHGWVQGYSYDVVVTATKGYTVIPLLACADTASLSEYVAFANKIDDLPQETVNVVADGGYDSNAFGEKIEYDENGHHTGRRFICPPNARRPRERSTKRRPQRKEKRSAKRRAATKRRRKRIAFYESKKGRRLYARRGQTAEPFNEWLKSLFELSDQVWHRGLANNQTQLLGAIFCYQLLVRYNRRCGRQNGQIRWIVDSL